MKRHDRVRLRHMADAMDAAMRFVEGRNRSDLESDEMLLFALVRAIEIVGEAASKISDEARAEMPELPWASIVGCGIGSCMPISRSIATSYGLRSQRQCRRWPSI
jgi:uncharacterized protein with HEPN domain